MKYNLRVSNAYKKYMYAYKLYKTKRRTNRLCKQPINN